MTSPAPTTAIRIVVADCRCVTRYDDHDDAGWTWSDVTHIATCAACAAWLADQTAKAEAAVLGKIRACEPGPDGLADWERALLASVAG